MNRTRDYYRKMRKKFINRKKQFCLNVYKYDYYEHDGEYSKNKVFCSCPLCKMGENISYIKSDLFSRLDLNDFNNNLGD